MTPRRIVLAPDSFKGALSAHGVCLAMARGLWSVWPDAEIVTRPMADGGEGTLAVLAASLPGTEHTTATVGPLGAALQAGWWCASDGDWAVVELARASGLGVCDRLEPRRATTAGTGLQIAAARRSGAKRISLAVGGSATVDGGVGALTALGFRLLDARGHPVPPRPDALIRVAEIVAPEGVETWPELDVWCDVDNPLCGPEGAARVYGPQKGADGEAVAVLEAGLAHWGGVLARTFGRDPRDLPGAGAAGGIAGGLWAALGARIVPGFDAIAAAVGLDQALEGADLVLTGEGRVDAQSARGKVVGGVLARTTAPVWVLAGQVTAEAEAWLGDRAVACPIVDGPRSLSASMIDTAALVERTAARGARLVTLGAVTR